ncbi:MAG: 2-C-methyl-D-erythritol 4-phosphate cytidylyltransferase [Bacteroidales bacterium]|nr:2-C-methyl-D-erythritol 4-phosphate cytidylyltransferase [Bacteroidales bacterium]
MERKKFLIVTAGGKGVRMGGAVPKQFMEIGGKAVLRLSIERFLEAVPDIKVMAVLPQEHIALWKEYCIRTGFVCPQTIVPGGFTRFHSVKNALARIPDGAAVAVHDGVRPFVPVEMIRDMFDVAVSAPAVVPVVPVVDTLKVLRRVEGDGGTERLEPVTGASADRSVLFGAQTPQVFHSEVLREAYMQAFDPLFTDDASVVERKNIPVRYVDGDRNNIKITTREDLVLAEAIMSLKAIR